MHAPNSSADTNVICCQKEEESTVIKDSTAISGRAPAHRGGHESHPARAREGGSMSMLRRGIALAVTAGSLLFASGTPTGRGAARRGATAARRPRSTPEPTRSTTSRRQQTDFVRPGFKIKINSVTIGADRKPVVDVNITDDLGQPIDRNGILTPGRRVDSPTCSPGTTARPATTRRTRRASRRARSRATARHQPTSDSGGEYKDIDLGHYKYTFGKTVSRPAST